LQLEKQQQGDTIANTNYDDGSSTYKDKSYYAASTAVISPDAKLGKSCRIGNFVVIGRNCTIGDYTVIHDKVTLAQNCTIGSNCLIQSGVTIGEDGFAYERHVSSGDLERFPHFGGVVIGNNVEISANCSIARGSLTDTIIGEGTKIDALVHIAHNVRIGKNCQLTAGTVIGGSTQLGDSCWTGLNCTIKNKVNVGNNVIIGAGACAIKDIQDGDVVAGVPAKSIKNKVSTSEVFQMAGQTKSGAVTNSGGIEQ
jgi:UDP-3-O-[3-hydroxymyristoyl] glucosamine N-acyltransferase